MTGALHARFSLQRQSGLALEIALDVPEGQTTVILGPNGAGKTTALEAIAGLLPIDRGQIRLGERILDDPAELIFVEPADRDMGLHFQDYLLFPHMTAEENVAFGLRQRGAPREDARRQASQWLEKLDVGSMGGQTPDRLSGGQAQRVALARALAPNPACLLLDEPLAALDVATRARLRLTLREHLEEFPGPRLLVTHDPADAFFFGDRIEVFEEGRVTQSGTPDEIKMRPATRYIAEVAGVNRLEGHASSGSLSIGSHTLVIPETDVEGPVSVLIPPSAISVHRSRPEGSARNTWETVVDHVEPLGTRARLMTGQPLPLLVDVTLESVAALDIERSTRVWLALKATEIAVERS